MNKKWALLALPMIICLMPFLFNLIGDRHGRNAHLDAMWRLTYLKMAPLPLIFGNNPKGQKFAQVIISATHLEINVLGY